jgi:hypothetical protein
MSGMACEHGEVCSLGTDRFGYFGWPSVARTRYGGRPALVVAASGLREDHVCPFGRTVTFHSFDEGRTWTAPRVINDTPADDRDTGVVALGERSLLLTWFSVAWWRQTHARRPEAWHRQVEAALCGRGNQWTNAYLRLSADGGETWGEVIEAPVSAPHGPIVLADGGLLYLGKSGYAHRRSAEEMRDCPIQAHRSDDGGRSWRLLGEVPPPPQAANRNVYEPHAVELPGGRLIGVVRFQVPAGDDEAEHRRWADLTFSLARTASDDGGRTWSPPEMMGVLGSPPHLLRHADGTLVCVYGYRREPFGIRAILSRDDGRAWSEPLVLRDDGPSWDLGYPASVALDDGSLFTVYYFKPAADAKAAVLWTRWRLP